MDRPGKIRTNLSKPALNDQIHSERTSAVDRYRDFFVGAAGWAELVRYELITSVCAGMPGAVGFLLRKMLYPRLFMKAGRDVLWGRHIALRHPGRIRIGAGTAVDDYCMLDARGAGPEGVTLEDHVLVSRNCVIQGKQGPVHIGARTNFGCNCVVTSVGGVRIGAEVLLAANCYIGGGRYHSDHAEVSIMNQGLYSLGEVVIGDGVWLGSGATVLDGVRIGSRTVVGAGAVVIHDLPENVIAGGTPAKVLRVRGAPRS